MSTSILSQCRSTFGRRILERNAILGRKELSSRRSKERQEGDCLMCQRLCVSSQHHFGNEVARWATDSVVNLNTHTHTGADTRTCTQAGRQTQRVLLGQCVQSGAVAGLVTSIRQRVRVWGTRDKRQAECVSQRREWVCGCVCAGYLPLYSSLKFLTRPFQLFLKSRYSEEPAGQHVTLKRWSTVPESDLRARPANQDPGSQDLFINGTLARIMKDWNPPLREPLT